MRFKKTAFDYSETSGEKHGLVEARRCWLSEEIVRLKEKRRLEKSEKYPDVGIRCGKLSLKHQRLGNDVLSAGRDTGCLRRVLKSAASAIF